MHNSSKLTTKLSDTVHIYLFREMSEDKIVSFRRSLFSSPDSLSWLSCLSCWAWLVMMSTIVAGSESLRREGRGVAKSLERASKVTWSHL